MMLREPSSVEDSLTTTGATYGSDGEVTDEAMPSQGQAKATAKAKVKVKAKAKA